MLAHFGERVVPFFRAGVGVFAASQSRVGRESEFESGGFWGLGLGIDVWLGRRVVAGLSGSYLDGALNTAEIGLHIGYA